MSAPPRKPQPQPCISKPGVWSELWDLEGSMRHPHNAIRLNQQRVFRGPQGFGKQGSAKRASSATFHSRSISIIGQRARAGPWRSARLRSASVDTSPGWRCAASSRRVGSRALRGTRLDEAQIPLGRPSRLFPELAAYGPNFFHHSVEFRERVLHSSSPIIFQGVAIIGLGRPRRWLTAAM